MISTTILSNLRTLTTVRFIRFACFDMLCDSHDATERKALEKRKTYPEVFFNNDNENHSQMDHIFCFLSATPGRNLPYSTDCPI